MGTFATAGAQRFLISRSQVRHWVISYEVKMVDGCAVIAQSRTQDDFSAIEKIALQLGAERYDSRQFVIVSEIF